MALNPPVANNGVPFRVQGEVFLIMRENVECDIKIDGLGKYNATGRVWNTLSAIHDVFSDVLRLQQTG